MIRNALRSDAEAISRIYNHYVLNTVGSCFCDILAHDLLVAALQRVGFAARKPRGSFYLYLKIPKGTADGRTFASAEELSEFLITESLISTVPWDDVGHYVRLSVTFTAKDEAEEWRIIGEIERRLIELAFVF